MLKMFMFYVFIFINFMIFHIFSLKFFSEKKIIKNNDIYKDNKLNTQIFQKNKLYEMLF